MLRRITFGAAAVALVAVLVWLFLQLGSTEEPNPLATAALALGFPALGFVAIGWVVRRRRREEEASATPPGTHPWSPGPPSWQEPEDHRRRR